MVGIKTNLEVCRYLAAHHNITMWGLWVLLVLEFIGIIDGRKRGRR